MAAAPAEAKEKPVLLVGDSLAFMLGPRFVQAAKHFGKKTWTVAKGGTNTEQWTKKWFVQALTRHNPSLVLVSLGTNDWGVKPHREAFQKNARKLVQLAHSNGVPVCWLLPPKMDPRKVKTEFIRRAMPNVAPDLIFDAESLEIPLINDGVHPTHEGLVRWANALADSLWGSK